MVKVKRGLRHKELGLTFVEIVEKEKIEAKGLVALEGMPDVGLVGVIATSYLVDALKMREVAYIKTDLMPPIRVLHEGKLKNPIRIYSNEKFIILTSELAIPPDLIYPLAKKVVEWFRDKGISMIISINGYPYKDRLEIEVPKVFGVANMESMKEFLKRQNIEVIEEGFIAGFYAVLLDEASHIGVPGVALLAQAFPRYPDPGAAASVIRVLSKILEFDVDVKPLLEKADEIRVKVRDLMKQTHAMMAGMKKGVEQQIPAMYR